MMNTQHTGIRTKILEHLHGNPCSTAAEMVELFGADRKSVIDNLSAARKEGYLTSQRDDVTKQMGYTLTPKGRARVTNGRQTINGKTAAENVRALEEARMDVIGQNGNEGLHYATEPIVTDPPALEAYFTSAAVVEALQGAMEAADPAVDHPTHYTSHPSGVECITITEHMNFCLGNAVKYLWRAGLKQDALEDLKKARWYLDREIARRGARQ